MRGAELRQLDGGPGPHDFVAAGLVTSTAGPVALVFPLLFLGDLVNQALNDHFQRRYARLEGRLGRRFFRHANRATCGSTGVATILAEPERL